MDNISIIGVEKSYNEEIRKQLLSFYRLKGIDIPQSVMSSIDDILQQIEFEEDIGNALNVYTSETKDQLLSDIDIHTNISVHVKELSSGNITRKFTYCGSLQSHYEEDIQLQDEDEDDVTQLSKIDSSKQGVENKIIDESQWLVLVVEEISFSEGTSEVHQRLYVYAPDQGKELEEDNPMEDSILYD